MIDPALYSMYQNMYMSRVVSQHVMDEEEYLTYEAIGAMIRAHSKLCAAIWEKQKNDNDIEDHDLGDPFSGTFGSPPDDPFAV